MSSGFWEERMGVSALRSLPNTRNVRPECRAAGNLAMRRKRGRNPVADAKAGRTMKSGFFDKNPQLFGLPQEDGFNVIEAFVHGVEAPVHPIESSGNLNTEFIESLIYTLLDAVDHSRQILIKFPSSYGAVVQNMHFLLRSGARWSRVGILFQSRYRPQSRSIFTFFGKPRGPVPADTKGDRVCTESRRRSPRRLAWQEILWGQTPRIAAGPALQFYKLQVVLSILHIKNPFQCLKYLDPKLTQDRYADTGPA